MDTSAKLRRTRPRFSFMRRRTPAAAPPGAAEPSRSARPQTAAPTYSTQLIPFEAIAWIVRWLARLACIPSFAVGVVGNIGMFGGSVAALYAQPLTYPQTNGAVFIASSIYQLIIQLCQIYTAKMYGRASVAYRFFVTLSVLPSVWSYGVVLVPLAGSAVLWGDMWLIRIPIYLLTPIVLLAVLWLNDLVQEVILVKEPVRR